MVDNNLIKKALLIRRVEETFMELFSLGKLNGTVHTCIGQEFSALAFAGQLEKGDFVFSNHRCHGHYIAFTGDSRGLIAELMGKKSGVCGGVGSSQHLCEESFFSNGVQGGIAPVSAGLALARKLQKKNAVGLVYVGDGTLGEGVVYETMNIISKWEIPLLMVCENNLYAQSTHQSTNLAGDILKRAEAFDVRTFSGDTWDVESLMTTGQDALKYVRTTGKPAFCLVNTYRLAPHSKGDDNRRIEEVQNYKDRDPIHIFSRQNPQLFEVMLSEINLTIDSIVKELDNEGELTLNEYVGEKGRDSEIQWGALESMDLRQVELINQFFSDVMSRDPSVIFMGEDVLSPYGGAFKVAKGLSEKYPHQVFSTPISEAAISGIANGLALGGMRPFLEVMFGDFMTLCMDQLINHASKFHHMYNKKVCCPVVIRTPMGGGRGYGPTHSQSLDKFLVGIDNVTTLALNCLINPAEVFEKIYNDEKHPVVVLENKTDYGKKIGKIRVPGYKFEVTRNDYPTIKIAPAISKPTATLVTYGGMAEMVINGVERFLMELDLKVEILVITKICPIDYRIILDSVGRTRKLFVVEEGSAFAGIGSEIIAGVAERMNEPFLSKRISAIPIPIPSVKSLENQVLPNLDTVVAAIKVSLT